MYAFEMFEKEFKDVKVESHPIKKKYLFAVSE